MTENEKILKYLSGMLTEKELADFNEELNSNANLRSELEKINSELESIKFIPEVDEDYFTELVRKSKTKRKSRVSVQNIRYALSLGVAAVIVFFFALTGKVNKNSDVRLNDILNQNKIVNDISVDAISENYSISDLENLNVSVDDYLSESISSVDDNTLISYISSDEIGDVEDLISTVSLTDENFNSIITSLKSKNY
jgi:hypothetical protein